MGDVSTSTAESLRCPRCSAMLRAGTEWCSLCYTDLRPREEPAPPAPATPGAHPELLLDRDNAVPSDIVTPGPASSAGPSTRPGGKHARKPEFGAVTTPDEAEVDRLAAQMLAELAAAEGGTPLGAATGLVDSTGKKVLLIAGVGLGVLSLLFVLMAAAGALL